MDRIIRSLGIMSCPDDMEQIDEMIKILYAHIAKDNPLGKQEEDTQNE